MICDESWGLRSTAMASSPFMQMDDSVQELKMVTAVVQEDGQQQRTLKWFLSHQAGVLEQIQGVQKKKVQSWKNCQARISPQKEMSAFGDQSRQSRTKAQE